METRSLISSMECRYRIGVEARWARDAAAVVILQRSAIASSLCRGAALVAVLEPDNIVLAEILADLHFDNAQ